MPSLTLDINPKGELHKRILAAVRDRVQASKKAFRARHAKWIKDEEAAVAYLPERDVDALRRADREQGSPQYTTIQIPYSYAILMSAHTYWTSVFMARDPVFQVSGRHGEAQQQVQALEALLSYQTQVGAQLVPLYIWLMDAGKYGLGVVGIHWDERHHYISAIEEVGVTYLGLRTGKTRKQKVRRIVKGYSGNRIFNVRPYDFFPDPRVPVHRFQDGEFCGVYTELGWNTLLRRKELGYYTNLEAIRHPGRASAQYGGAGEREAGSSQIELPSPENYYFEGPRTGPQKGAQAEVIPVYEMVIDLVPETWGIGRGAMPEKWVFTVTADLLTVLGASPLGANHDQFPYQVLEYEPEGYGLAKRGLPEVLEPVQQTLDWLINSHFYNVRAALNNQFVVDPSRVTMKDLLDPLPGNLIRLKPEAYGTDPRLAVHQLQSMDVTQNHLRDVQLMHEFGQRVVGVNDQIMGMLQTGGRRTAQEVRSSTTFGINRLKTNCEYFSAMGWAPLAQMLIQNSQQYFEGEVKLRIVGDLAQGAGAAFMDVTPESIAGQYDFVPVDGSLPIDRFAQANLWRELFAQLRNFPEIAQGYDLGRIFEWVAQLSGLKNITQFRTQVVPDQTLQAQAQQGNAVPAQPSDLTRVGEPGQLPGLGTTG